MKLRSKLRVAPTIPFIALADIAWQLVIFFLVASAFIRNESLKVDLPSSTNQPQANKNEPITVHAGQSVLIVNGKNLGASDLSGLEQEIRRQLVGRKSEQERAVVVIPKPDLTFQRDVDVMYAVQKAGGILVMSQEK